MPKQFMHRHAIIGTKSNANAEGQYERLIFHLEWLSLHHRKQIAGNDACLISAIDLRQQDKKLVSTQSSHGIYLSQLVDQAPRHLTEHGVSRPMAKNIVDVLESIEIEKENSTSTGEPLRSLDDPL
nr:hypothetical protein [Rhodanobacter glycinis]